MPDTAVNEVRTTLRDDLIAAKALIDTPEKFNAMGRSRSAAVYEATTSWQAYVEADQALSRHRVRGVGYAAIIDQFDRAIASAESSSWTVAGQVTDERLAEVLKPFAALGQYIIDQEFITKRDDAGAWGLDGHTLTYGDFRSAAAALTELQHRREAEAGEPEAWAREMDINGPCLALPVFLRYRDVERFKAEKGNRDAVFRPLYLAASPSSPASGVRADRDAIIEEMAQIFDQFPDDKMLAKQAASRIRSRKSALGEHP